MRAALVFVLLVAGGMELAPAGSSDPCPRGFLEGFLRWYLPVAFEKGSAVVLDVRMDKAVTPVLLRKWRREAATGEGPDAVPFVGQDFDERWARGVEVGAPEKHGRGTRVPVVYRSPDWVVRSVFELEPAPGGWRIRGWTVVD